MTNIIDISDICPFCKKKQAILICDFPVGTKWTTEETLMGNFRRNVVTCNNKMCEQCALHISHEVDLCPTCTIKIKHRM